MTLAQQQQQHHPPAAIVRQSWATAPPTERPQEPSRRCSLLPLLRPLPSLHQPLSLHWHLQQNADSHPSGCCWSMVE